jgi:cation diffusion facilitator family transporter
MNPSDLPTNDQAVSAREADTKRSTWVSVAVNIGLTISQVAAGIFSGSQGLIADGVHSMSDLVADCVVLVAVQHSRKAADDDHHYGHHRYETAASLILGGLLLAVGIGMLWSAIHKIGNPDSIAPVQSLALWVALGALVVKEGLFRYMLAVATRLRSTMLVANAWHARSDAASSLVVAVGIGGSLLGYPLLDPVAALIVGIMVAKMGGTFTWDALHDLMDRATDDEQIEAMRGALLATPGVLGVHDLKTRKMGDMILLDAHLEVDGRLNLREGHDIAVAARQRIMTSFPVLNVMTHLDPVDRT